MQGEDALHRHPERVLAHGERLVNTTTLALNTEALKVLYSFSVALDNPVANPHGIACTELRHTTLPDILTRDQVCLLSWMVSGASDARLSSFFASPLRPRPGADPAAGLSLAPGTDLRVVAR